MGSPPSKRNYRREYDTYHAKAEQRKNRSTRNKARRTVAKAQGVGVKSVKGDVGHKNSLKNGGSNAKSNLKVQSVKSNRSAGGKSSSGTKGKTFTKRKKR